MLTTGTGVILTPISSGNVEIKLNASFYSDTTGDGLMYNIYYGQGTALQTANATPTPTLALLPANISFPLNEAGIVASFSLDYILKGLTIGTSYVFEVVYANVNGGKATFTQEDMWVIEIN